MGFWPYWQPSSNKLAIFIISWSVYMMLFVENKFFFFFYSRIRFYFFQQTLKAL